MRISDWSSDVCSSDLFDAVGLAAFLIVELVEPFLADAFGGLRLRENLAREPRIAPRKCAVREQEVRRRHVEIIVDEEGGDRSGALVKRLARQKARANRRGVVVGSRVTCSGVRGGGGITK